MDESDDFIISLSFSDIVMSSKNYVYYYSRILTGIVYFVVALKYKEALKDEELDRKGLDYADKIEKVEVFG